MREKNQRIDFIDTAKGIPLLFVLYLHICVCYPGHPYITSDINKVVGTFFMPVYFMLSGLFFSSKDSFPIWIKKKSKRLLVPYCFFYIVTYLLNGFTVNLLGIDTKSGFDWKGIFSVFHSDVFPNCTTWFLLALFWGNLMFYLIDKYFKNWWTKLFAVIAMFGCGVACSKIGFNIPLYIDSAMSMLPFLLLGYYLKKKEFLNSIWGGQKLLFLVLFIVLAVIDILTAQSVSLINNYLGNPIQYLLGALTGSLAVIYISAFVQKIPVITYLGRNSLVVLCVHGYVLNVVTIVLKKTPIDMVCGSVIALIIVSLSFYLIVPLFQHYLPWAIGENKKN